MPLTSLAKRFSEGNLRELRVFPSHLIDFTSNDYLGLARSKELLELIAEQSIRDGEHLNGSTGSRLLSGNSKLAEDLEIQLSGFHGSANGLLFNSGYDANLGLFSCVAKRGDTILYDELIHASVIDGIRLSNAFAYKFRHNDLGHLELLISRARGSVYVAVESIYSMDGDLSPLAELSEICKKHQVRLLVDEAHATGIFGKKGEGRVSELGLEQAVWARVHTFGKAMGCHGAIVLGSRALRDFLVNFSRPFIFSTALPAHSLVSIKCAYQFLETHRGLRSELEQRILYFRSKAAGSGLNSFSDHAGPIQTLHIPGNEQVKKLSLRLQAEGFDVRAITNPTVPAGKERIRICLHAYNTQEQLDGLINSVSRNI
jgi:8-amino-7-oxononanoate synthase